MVGVLNPNTPGVFQDPATVKDAPPMRQSEGVPGRITASNQARNAPPGKAPAQNILPPEVPDTRPQSRIPVTTQRAEKIPAGRTNPPATSPRPRNAQLGSTSQIPKPPGTVVTEEVKYKAGDKVYTYENGIPYVWKVEAVTPNQYGRLTYRLVNGNSRTESAAEFLFSKKEQIMSMHNAQIKNLTAQGKKLFEELGKLP